MSHTLELGRDWEYTRSRTPSGITFAFHSSENCPGYTVEVLNWRIFKDQSEGSKELAGTPELLDAAIEELTNTLGYDVFPSMEDVVHNELAELFPRQGLRKASSSQTDYLADKENTIKAVARSAWLRFSTALLEPKVATLAIPLLELVIRGNRLYKLEQRAWSYRTPPRFLDHLALGGFGSRLPYGILTFNESTDDAWIVRRFSQCEVDTKLDLKKALAVEFPYLSNLESRFCQGAPQDDLLTIVEAAEFANVSERTVRDWLKRIEGDKPMLPGVVKQGRIYRIPRTALVPYRKNERQTRPPRVKPQKRSSQKHVKRKS